MAKKRISSSDIEEILAANQWLEQQETDAQTGLPDLGIRQAGRTVGDLPPKPVEVGAFSRSGSSTPLLDKKRGITPGMSSMERINALGRSLNGYDALGGAIDMDGLGMPSSGTSINSGGAALGLDDLGMPSLGTSINSGGAAAPGGLAKLGVQRKGNTYSASPGAAPEPGDYEPNPNVSYGRWTPVLRAPSFGGFDPAKMMQAFADGGPIYGPPGEDMVPAEMPDGSPARLDDGEFVLPKDYVVAYAAKALGKKGASLPREKLHALGVDLLTQDVTEMTGKAPGAKTLPPLPGQVGMAPGMAGGGPIQEYGRYPYVESLPPQERFANRDAWLRAQLHPAEAARANNTIGAARAAGAQAPEFMRTPPLSNNLPTPYEGPVRFARPPAPMAAPMQPPLATYSGSPATSGSASYWRGMGAPPSNQMPVRYSPPGMLTTPRQSGALAAQPLSPGAAPESVIRVDSRGVAARGIDPRTVITPDEAKANLARAGMGPRATGGVPEFGSVPGAKAAVARDAARARYAEGGRAAAIGGKLAPVASAVGALNPAMDSVILADIAKDPVFWARQTFGIGPDYGPNNGPGIEMVRDVPVVTENGRRMGPIDPRSITSDSATRPMTHVPEGFTPGTPGNTQGYADRVKAQLAADQQARGEAYARITGMSPRSVTLDDQAYLAGLEKGFQNYEPGRNYAAQINRGGRQGTPQPARRETPWQQQATKAATELAQRWGISRGAAAQYVLKEMLDAYKPQAPSLDAERFQYQLGRDKISDAKWAAEQQAAAEQAMMQQAGNAYRNIIMVPQWDENTREYANAPYFFGPTGLVPLLGGNMGNSGQAPIVDRGYTKK